MEEKKFSKILRNDVHIKYNIHGNSINNNFILAEIFIEKKWSMQLMQQTNKKHEREELHVNNWPSYLSYLFL